MVVPHVARLLSRLVPCLNIEEVETQVKETEEPSTLKKSVRHTYIPSLYFIKI